MCECGCTMNDDRYTLPAPKGAIYLITLSGPCTYCDAPAGVSIERIEKGQGLHAEYRRGEFGAAPLELQDWRDSAGAAIITGHLKHEFVAATLKHLVGVSSDEIGENGRIDDAGAEVLLEDMYDDAQYRPKVVTPAES